MTYQDFRVHVDSPAADPSLGFADLADALTQIAHQSDPRFAIGIFGDWGSGKTTLMAAIQQRLDALTAPLKQYLSTAEATRSTDTRLVRFQAEMGAVRAQLEAVRAVTATDQQVSDVASRLDALSSQLPREMLSGHGGIDEKSLRSISNKLGSAVAEDRGALVDALGATLDQIDDVLFEMRRRSAVVAAS